MRVQLLRSDGSVFRTFDTDSYGGERLMVALMECQLDREEKGGDPVYSDRIREDFHRQAEELGRLLGMFFPEV